MTLRVLEALGPPRNFLTYRLKTLMGRKLSLKTLKGNGLSLSQEASPVHNRLIT